MRDVRIVVKVVDYAKLGKCLMLGSAGMYIYIYIYTLYIIHIDIYIYIYTCICRFYHAKHQYITYSVYIKP